MLPLVCQLFAEAYLASLSLILITVSFFLRQRRQEVSRLDGQEDDGRREVVGGRSQQEKVG